MVSFHRKISIATRFSKISELPKHFLCGDVYHWITFLLFNLFSLNFYFVGRKAILIIRLFIWSAFSKLLGSYINSNIFLFSNFSPQILSLFLPPIFPWMWIIALFLVYSAGGYSVHFKFFSWLKIKALKL
jgi:hypothetical protein